MSTSLGLSAKDFDSILQASMPKGEILPKPADLMTFEISPMPVIQASMDAESAVKRGDSEEAQYFWLKSIRVALDLRTTSTEPYRMYGNLASTAFINGDYILGEIALDIALRLNPNYSFGRMLEERKINGEFIYYGLQKITESPLELGITAEDLATVDTSEILNELAVRGINLTERNFITMADSVKDTIDNVVDKALATTNGSGVDKDYVHAACQALWDRLIKRPLFETILDIVLDLDDMEIDTDLYFDSISKLAWAFDEADKTAIVCFQKYPGELAELRFSLHNLLAYEVLNKSNAGEQMLRIATKAFQSGIFPDMAIADTIKLIAKDDANWQDQLKKLIDRNMAYVQVIVMGLARGMLEAGKNRELLDICKFVWGKVTSGQLRPEEPEIYVIRDYLITAYQEIGDQKSIEKVERDAETIAEMLEAAQKKESQDQDERFKRGTYKLLKEKGDYPELFAYEDFLQSLGLDFATTEATEDHTMMFHYGTKKKIGRNERCPCGSGIKYKKCHGANV